ncbi:MAG TPA: tetratricopeptide repeat protein [Terriglobales bacterium]|nr:tetratricopeptide repeat protein [Terriglobales bacterium]
MRFILPISLFISLIIFSSSALPLDTADSLSVDPPGQPVDSAQYINLIIEGINATLNENYLYAQGKFRQIIKEKPEDPAGYFFLGALYQAEMMDYEGDFKEEEFYSELEIAIRLARNRIKSGKETPWDYLYLGNAYGYLGVYKARKGGWWPAFKNALKAKSAFKKAVELDPKFYDAYVGLGSYHYWTSYYTKSFAWLPFFADDREKGIEELKLAAKESLFSRVAALNALIWIYIKEKNYSLAIALADSLQKEYPDGKIFLWALATAYYEKYDWHNAIEFYGLIKKRLDNNPAENYFNLIECQYIIADSYFNLGDFTECISTCREALSYDLDKRMRERQKDKLNKIRELLDKSLKITGRK